MTPTQEQELWQADQLSKVATPERVNPCVGLFGKGPEGVTCKRCTHIYHNGRYLKCDFRTHTNGPGSDHKAGWPACAKFEAKP